MNFHIITLFPGAFKSYFGESIIKRAIEDEKIVVRFYNPRHYTEDRHKRIDRAPYGGGPGMVIQAEPVVRAVADAYSLILTNKRIKDGAGDGSAEGVGKRGERTKTKKLANARMTKMSKIRKPKILVVWTIPGGRQFDNKLARDFSKKYTDIIVVCGRYEGIDERAKEAIKKSLKLKVADISVGPFVLTGGEIPAMIVIDSVSRQIEGVLGDINSLEENRVASSAVYTRPEIFKYRDRSYKTPKILLSGHHKRIEEWKKSKRG